MSYEEEMVEIAEDLAALLDPGGGKGPDDWEVSTDCLADQARECMIRYGKRKADDE